MTFHPTQLLDCFVVEDLDVTVITVGRCDRALAFGAGELGLQSVSSYSKAQY